MSTGFQEFYFSASDGLQLYGRKYGWENHDPHPVVCLPGLTRNSDDFAAIATHLAGDGGGNRRVVTFDYRGRGKSAYDRDWQNYNILKEAEDVLTGLTAIGLGQVNILGTSRGGIIAFVIAATRPGVLKSVILNDIGPELSGPGLVRIKRNMEKSRAPKTMDEAALMLENGFKRSFPNLGADDWKRQAGVIYREENGKLVLNYDRKLLHTFKAINLDAPLADMWPQFRGLSQLPCMLIHGKLSDLLTDEIVNKMLETKPDLHVHAVSDEGHAPLLRDEDTRSAISRFLEKI